MKSTGINKHETNFTELGGKYHRSVDFFFHRSRPYPLPTRGGRLYLVGNRRQSDHPPPKSFISELELDYYFRGLEIVKT